jgi:site-specific recombinase XerD
LRHPKFHPRSELPEYLSASQLKNLLEYAANNLELRDFAIISLLATTEIYTHLSPRHFKELMNLHPYPIRLYATKELQMDTNSLITEYLEYLEHSCGFAIRS